MKRRLLFFTALATMLAVLIPPGSAALVPVPAQDYAGIREPLRASGVRVLLPLAIPSAVRPVRSIAVISADASGYYVGFSPLAHCGGGLSCAFFHVAGSRAQHPAGQLGRRARRLRLHDGRSAVFHPRDCSGASCTEASLTFERDGADYELDVKVPANDLVVLECAYQSLRPLR